MSLTVEEILHMSKMVILAYIFDKLTMTHTLAMLSIAGTMKLLYTVVF